MNVGIKTKITIIGLCFLLVLILGAFEGESVFAENASTTVTISGADTTPPTVYDLSKSSLTYGSVNISWTTNEDVASSSIDYGISTSSLTTIEESYGVRSHQVSLASLLENTLYYFQIRSEDASNNTSTYSYDLNGSDYSFTTLVNHPPDITEIATSSRTQTTINITWITNELATSYIDYGTSTGSLSQTTGTSTLSTSQEVELSSLTTGTPYYFQVRSADAESNSTTDNNSGDFYSFTTKGPVVTVSGISASSVGTTTATIGWTTSELASSIVDYGLTTLSVDSTVSSTSLTTSHSLSLTGLSADTIYYYQIRGVDSIEDSFTDDNSGDYYNFTTQAVTTDAGGSVVLPPSSSSPTAEYLDIGELEVLINNGNQYTNNRSITVGFKKFAYLTQFQISEENDFEGVEWQDIEELYNWDLSDYDGKKYLYFKFKNSDDKATDSVQKSIILDRIAPSPPVNFKGFLITDGIDLSWFLPSEGDTAGVRIFRSENGHILDSLFNGNIFFEGNKEKAFDFNTTEGKIYYYTAFSYDHARNYSNAALFEIKYIPIEKEIVTISDSGKKVDDKEIDQAEIDVPEEVSESNNQEIVIDKDIKEKEDYIDEETEDIKEVFIREVEDVSIDIEKNEMPVSISSSRQEISQFEQKVPIKTFHYLERTPITVILEDIYEDESIEMIVLRVGDISKYVVKKDESAALRAKIETPPGKGSYDLRIEITYKDKTKEVVEIAELLVDPYGYVYQESIEPLIKFFTDGKIVSWEQKKKEVRINNAEVTLYKLNEKTEKWIEFRTKNYNQKNPQFTDQEGRFGYMVPKGTYHILAKKDGFGEVRTENMEVMDVVINKNIKISSVITSWWKVRENLPEIGFVVMVLSFSVIIGFVIFKKIF